MITRWFRQVMLLVALVLAGAAVARAEENLDLAKAVKVGSGPVMVIEITDPDCPYCKKAEAYFQGRRDVTRYIFFYPLSSHPAAKGKVQYILSAPDKAQAYREVMAGNFDRKKLEEVTPEGVKLQEEHVAMARANGFRATPIFVINSRIIRGFSQQKIEEAIKP